VICEVVGGDVFNGCLRALAWSGRIVVLGFAGGGIPSIPANYLLLKNISVTGLHWSDYRERHPEWMRRGHEVLFDLYRKGLLGTQVPTAYPVEQVVEAMRQLRDRLVKGKIILTMAG
jgi:NADPH2:quinone reductase